MAASTRCRPTERQTGEDSLSSSARPGLGADPQPTLRKRDPRQNERAARDPKHKMALVFRWYLGQSPVWANRGEIERKHGLSDLVRSGDGRLQRMGARAPFSKAPPRRQVVAVAYNILFGAALLHAGQSVGAAGRYRLAVPRHCSAPLEIAQIKEYLR